MMKKLEKGKNMKDKKVALVLSGGSALGFAHVGVIDVLQKYNVPIDIIVGTSMGGLVGAAYASGMTVQEMTKFACKFRRIHFFDVNFNASGLFSGKGVMRNINKFLPDKKIENCKTKFACVSCDLLTEKEVVFKSGSIRDAVRSTLSIPGFFVPFKKGNQLLIDGGCVNNMPDDVAKNLGADIIISVDVLEFCKVENRPKNAIETLVGAINILTKSLQNIKATNSDIILRPNLKGFTQMSFGKTNALKIIEKGRIETEKHINEILKLIN